MANNNLVTQITIRAGVEGINDINRLADAIEEAGGDVGQLRQSARDLQNGKSMIKLLMAQMMLGVPLCNQ